MVSSITQTKPKMTLLLASPRGFCAGVARAVNIVEAALAKWGAPIFVRHQIVHNQAVVSRLAKLGAVFVESLDEVPDDVSNKLSDGGHRVIFSAHGVPPSIIAEAKARGFFVLDATCPLVSKVHAEVKRHQAQGRHVFLIGHRAHPEIIGTIGHLKKDGWSLIETIDDAKNISLPANVKTTAYATQTTLSVSETADIIAVLKSRFPTIATPNGADICYATTNRQQAVKELAPFCDSFFILGADNSSNAKRLVETARKFGAKHSCLIASAADIDWQAAIKCKSGKPHRVWGLSAGASTPDFLVKTFIEEARARFTLEMKTPSSIEENVVFRMPAELR